MTFRLNTENIIASIYYNKLLLTTNCTQISTTPSHLYTINNNLSLLLTKKCKTSVYLTTPSALLLNVAKNHNYSR